MVDEVILNDVRLIVTDFLADTVEGSEGGECRESDGQAEGRK